MHNKNLTKTKSQLRIKTSIHIMQENIAKNKIL